MLKVLAVAIVASWYNLPGHFTANGERFNPNELTAAHRTLPMGSRVRIRGVVVRINDRKPGPGIDVTPRVAKLLGFYHRGIARVRIQHIR